MSIMVVVRLLVDLLASWEQIDLGSAQFYYSISQVTLPAVVDNHWMAIVEVVFRNLVATQRPRTTHRS